MDEPKHLCFLCNSTAYENVSPPGFHVLSNNLDIMFLLKNLLQVPNKYLEDQLEKCGDNPASWINLCEQCTQINKTARELHQNILTLKKELESIQSQVLGKIKSPGSFSGTNNQEEISYHDENSFEFEHLVKSFVKNSDYKIRLDKDRQFLEGDQLARCIESQSQQTTAATLSFDQANTSSEEIKVEIELPSVLSLSPSPPSPSPEVASHRGGLRGGPRKKTKKPRKKGKGFHCEICGAEVGSYFSLCRHRRTIHETKKTQRLSSSSSSPSFSASKNEHGAFVCSICKKEFSLITSLRRHWKFVHEKRFNLSCHLCGMGAHNNNQLKLHLLWKHKDDPVAKQLEEDEGLKNIKCPVVGCASRFLKQQALDKHVEKFHGGNEKELKEIDKRFKCQFCGKGFWDMTKLRHHERIHEGKGKEDWKCEICGKGYSTKQYLRYHQLNTHKQAKRFQQS